MRFIFFTATVVSWTRLNVTSALPVLYIAENSCQREREREYSLHILLFLPRTHCKASIVGSSNHTDYTYSVSENLCRRHNVRFLHLVVPAKLGVLFPQLAVPTSCNVCVYSFSSLQYCASLPGTRFRFSFPVLFSSSPLIWSVLRFPWP